MKLVYPDYKNQLQFEEGVIHVTIIENEQEFTHLIGELCAQINGEDGRFVLSHEGDVIKISSQMQCIINPFCIEENGRRVMDKIYEQCKKVMLETELFIKQENLVSQLLSYIGEIAECIEYPLTYENEIDEKALLKLVNIRISQESNSLLERIMDYLKINYRLLGCKLFAFVNLKSYLSQKELGDLYMAAEYEKYHILLIESVQREYKDKREKIFVIDKDCCEIY